MNGLSKTTLILGVAAIALTACSSPDSSDAATTTDTAVKTASAASGDLCTTMGPQTPRDITSKVGLNTTMFDMAPPSTQMNLCNIHTHTNAEHKGPGFSIFAGATDDGGYQCNETPNLTEVELAPYTGQRSYEGAEPGDTIEVHWVHTTCDTEPGEGLGNCVSCDDPTLRVETQVLLVTNDGNGADMMDFAYLGNTKNGLNQPKTLPTGTGTPVQFLGSTTGPSYTQAVCSPAQVTWSVRPQCAKVDAASVHNWARSDKAFNETKSHGVRQLVTAPELLSEIK